MSAKARSAATAEELDRVTDSGDELHEVEPGTNSGTDGEGREDAEGMFDDDFIDAINDLATQDEDTGEGAGSAAEEDEEDREIAEGLADSDEDDLEGEGDELTEGLEDLPDGQSRDDRGRFAKAGEPEKPKAGDKAGENAGADAGAKAGAKAGADAGANGGEKPAQLSSAPQWEPFKVNADKQEHAIPEARISRANGHVFIAIPEAEYNRFNQRMSRSVMFESRRQQIEEGIRELEARKNAPPPPTRETVEAKLLTEAIKPYLADLFDVEEIDALQAKVDQQLANELKAYGESEEARVAQAASETPWEEEQLGGLAFATHQVRGMDPQLADLTDDEVKDVYLQELVPVANSLYFREGDGRFANTEYIHARLVARAKAKAISKQSAPVPGASATNAAPASTQTPTADAKATPDKADRFNRAVDQGPRRTTNLKAGRGQVRPPQSGNTRDDAPRRVARKTEHELQQELEDRKRRQSRRFMNSDSLDFDDEEELDEE